VKTWLSLQSSVFLEILKNLSGLHRIGLLCHTYEFCHLRALRMNCLFQVDRSVTGLVAQQQCVGPLHTPLADVAVTALSHYGKVKLVIIVTCLSSVLV
jgi:hypothetical protein